MALAPTGVELVLDVCDVDVRSLNGSRTYSSHEVLVRLLASAHRQERLLSAILARLPAPAPVGAEAPPEPEPTPRGAKPRKAA